MFKIASRIIIEQMEDNTNLDAIQRRAHNSSPRLCIFMPVPWIFIQTALLFYQQLPAYCVPICVRSRNREAAIIRREPFENR